MAEFHFVEDYERHVAALMAKYPIDEAMSLAVGGSYEAIGNVAREALLYAGIRDGMSVLDFGCGSGRVAHALSKKVEIKKFLGTDVVQALIDYASTKTPPHFKFVCHRELSIPEDDNVFDFAYAFSVFTHLLQTECFVYLHDIARTLKPGGKLLISFLEFSQPAHWAVFESSLLSPVLNTFVERNQWEVWAARSGMEVIEYIDGPTAKWDGPALGQSIAIMERR